MDDRSIRTRERSDGAIEALEALEALEDGYWIEIAPEGTFRQRALDVGSAVVRAALEGTDDPDEGQRQVAGLLRNASRDADRAFALAYAERLLDKLQATDPLTERVDIARAVITSAGRAHHRE